ncbi:hypothetical protein GXM_01693 [Nostoc sphaeroides CCNUC1]|uniref:Uncharacterized protein n=1 Tax=Nostoc sphaeroides CCNUC1 TaxID=2653204 RepID=A0A5P8VV28_9NOSO|nr:hypothetical protein GXM_01693 [Nostoc sphaeroides CCNUC1]
MVINNFILNWNRHDKNYDFGHDPLFSTKYYFSPFGYITLGS